ncbi:MAG: toll/interleukin-1 receptor domain-containing protein [Woeseiaceae bacterium]|nr:toll/interleukin-1 receptor domain-containing protein [Woeseiaceae bacterium]
MQIFISYRRQDSKSIARLIAEDLRSQFGQDAVFQDVTEIGPGADFPQTIQDAIERSDIFLALIGPNWVREGELSGTDYVRREVEAAFANRLEVLPILVEGATMPPEETLPDSMRLVSRLNAIQVDPGTDFSAHMATLFKAISDGESTRGMLGDQHRMIREARRAAHALDQAGWGFTADVTGDQYVFLLTLKRFLDSTKHLFKIQLKLARDLIRGIKSGRRGLDDAIREAADEIPVERYWLRRRLRNETDNMREIHGALLRLLSRNRALGALVPDLDALYEHLSMWVAKYECLRDDDGMCLVFVGVEQELKFPKNVEENICKAVDELDQALRFR